MTARKRIKVISIDLDDTLWDNSITLEYAEKKLFDWLCIHAPRITADYTPDALKAHRKELANHEPHLRHDMTQLRLESLTRIAIDKNYSKKLARKALDKYLAARNKVTLYDDVIPSLTLLSEQYHLIAVTNGNADICRIGLENFFKLAIAPSDTGTSKPDPYVFRVAMDRMDVLPDMIVHVGDEPATDILGAQKAGIRSIWINRNGMPWPDQYSPPDAVIGNMHELTQIEQLLI